MPDKENSALMLLSNIDHADKQIAGFKQRIETEREARRKHLDLLAARVKAGDSTGDRIADFLACHPDLMASTDFHDGPVAQYLRELDSNIKAHRGEPIFIVRSKKEYFGIGVHFATPAAEFYEFHRSAEASGCVPPPSHLRWHYKIEFGLLENPPHSVVPASVLPELLFDFQVPVAYLIGQNWLQLKTGEDGIKPAVAAQPTDDGRQKIFLPPLTELIRSKLFGRTSFLDGELSEKTEVVVGGVAAEEWAIRCSDYSLQMQLFDWLEKVNNIQPSKG